MVVSLCSFFSRSAPTEIYTVSLHDALPIFPYESVDEEVNHPEDEDEDDSRAHHKKVNAFLASATGSDDIIDYDNDDPEDEDLDATADDEADDFVEDEDFVDTDDDDDEDLPDGIEGQLSELDDDEDDE